MTRISHRAYKVKDVARILDVTPRRVEGWVEKEHIVPVVRGRGRGTKQQFSLENIIEAALLLDFQRIVGEKNPHLPKFVDVAKGYSGVIASAIHISAGMTPIRGDMTLAILVKDGQPADRLAGPYQSLQQFLEQHRRKGAIVLIPLDPLIRSLQERLTEHQRMG
jgi:hypothetical protein